MRRAVRTLFSDGLRCLPPYKIFPFRFNIAAFAQKPRPLDFIPAPP